jgi:exopolyphosphatase/guanosine-5'-triphosphate,3'-diphosphate pyrophosphatase
MVPPESSPQCSDTAKTVAAIDVGSNALRMVIAEVSPEGTTNILERLRRAVRLGQDTFRRGRLGSKSMRAAMSVLRDYKQTLELYDVELIRAVATSAVREAVNADTFLDQIFMATGLNVEVISTSEESRLNVSAVRHAQGGALGAENGDSLIADVGGGSTLLTVIRNGEIATSQSLRLGSIRLQEMLSTSDESPERSSELLRYHISNVVATAQGSLPLGDIKSFVAVGGDARFAADKIGKSTPSDDLRHISVEDFNKLVVRCGRHSAEELARKYGLPFADAETLNPALLVYQILLRKTKAKEMVVSRTSMRDGLLLELARHVTGQEDEDILTGVIHSAVTLAEKYRVDAEHAQTVATLSMRMFDELSPEHGLGSRPRLLLRIAALLHEIGGFVSSQAHHKHGYYLTIHSEIFGLSPREVKLVAHIARYHRRSVPKPSHLDYMTLPRESRVVVNKLAAILRVADAMSRGQVHREADFEFQRGDDEFIINIPGVSDLILEQRAIANKGDLFEDVYGMKIRLEEA